MKQIKQNFFGRWESDFNFVYFEIEERFGLVWVKLQKGRFHLQISNSGI